MREALVRDEPKNTQYQADLAASRRYLYLVHACRLIEKKRNNEAETALAKIEQVPPNDSKMWKERGRIYFALGQTDKAAADFRKAAELLEDKALEWRSSQPAMSESDKLWARLTDEVLLQRLTAAVERSPEDAARYWKRGEWYARHRRWKEAAADFQMALERKAPNDSWDWLHAAPVLVAAGDREGYHRLCRAMCKHFREIQSPYTADQLAKTGLLFPDAGIDMEWAYQLADQSLALGKNEALVRYFVFCKGLADYRRENYRAAVAGLVPLLPQTASDPQLSAPCHLVLAMALHRRGEEKAAREHLAQGAKLLSKHIGDPSRFPLYDSSRYSHDWLIAWLLHREAQALIEGKKAEPRK